MDKNGPIIIIEDDPDDQFVLEEVFGELKYSNQRMYFADGQSVGAFSGYINKPTV